MTDTQTIYVPPKFPATLLVAAGEGPTLIFNTDPANVLYLGDDNSIAAGDPLRTIALNGQSSVNVTGEFDLYGICSGTPIAVSKLQGGISILTGTVSIIGPVTATVTGSVSITGTPAVTISGTPTVSISGTPNVNITGQSVSLDVSAQTVSVNGVAGVFPIGSNALLLNLGTQTITPGNSFTTAVVDMLNYTSFNIEGNCFVSTQSTAGSALTTEINIRWYADAGATQLVKLDQGGAWAANTGAVTNDHFYVSGPCHARYMTIEVQNNGGASNMTLQLLRLFGMGRSLTKLTWQQFPPFGNMNGGLTMFPSTGDESSGTPVLLFNFVLAGSSTNWLPFYLFNQTLTVRFQISAVLNKNFVVAVARGLLNGGLVAGGGTPYVIWNPGNTAGTEFSTTLELPSFPCYLVANTTATASTISCIGTTVSD